MLGQVEYLNARYQGPCSLTNLRHGLGLVIDDQGNFFLSTFQNNLLHSHSFLHFTQHSLSCYGQFQQGRPHGAFVFHHNNLTALTVYQKGKIGKTVLVSDLDKDVVYVVANRGKYEGDFEVGNRVQGGDRIGEMMGVALGVSGTMCRPRDYVRGIVGESQKARCLRFMEAQDKNYLGWVVSGNREGLGIVLGKNMGVQSMGRFNELAELQGICTTCKGDTITHGIVNKGVLEVYPEQSRKKIFLWEHMKNVNFVNEGVYFEDAAKLREEFAMLIRAVNRFQKSIYKDHSFIDSLDKDFSQKSQDMQYSRKYLDEYSPPRNIATPQKPPPAPIITDLSMQHSPSNHKPGFIKQKTAQKSPEKVIIQQNINKTKKQLFEYFSKSNILSAKKNHESTKTIVKVSVRGLNTSKSKSREKRNVRNGSPAGKK